MDTTALADNQAIDVAAWVSVQPQFSGVESPLVLDIVTAAFGRLRAVAGEPVAEIVCNVFGDPFVKFADGSKASGNLGRKLYDPQPATPAIPDAIEILDMLRQKWMAYGLTNDEQKARAFDTRMDLLLMAECRATPNPEQPARAKGGE